MRVCSQVTVISCAARPARRGGEVSQIPDELGALVDRFEDPWPAVIDVRPGWYPLLRGLDAALAAIAPGYAIQQIKSKFGSLWFYAIEANNPDAYISEFRETIRLAEWRSIETCEDCGNPARQYTMQLHVWTLCAEHEEEKRSRADL